MELIKKHVDTVIVLGGILTSVMWMNGKFSSLEKDMTALKQEIAVIKTVLLMKDIMPKELMAKQKEEKPLSCPSGLSD